MKHWFKRTEIKLKNASLFSFRQAARRVFYPGCSLPGADPEFCYRVYGELRKRDPELGLWFDCCAMPLRMMRARQQAEREEEDLLRKMVVAGVEEVITACGNCYQQFAAFGEGSIKPVLLYDLLEAGELSAEEGDPFIHHPCFARQNPALQTGALALADGLGIRLKNRDSSEHPLACCLHRNAKAMQRRESLHGERLLTYCAHCVVSFQDDIPTRHLLQELYGSDHVWRPQGKIALFANYRRFCRLAAGQSKP